MPLTAPYGSWVSPIAAVDLAAGTHPVDSARFVGDQIWWSELRPDEGGRYVIRQANAAGAAEPGSDVLPAPWNARTRVHEYGGGAWTAAEDTLLFSEFTDQRIYSLHAGETEPVALTPLPPQPAGLRYAELTVHGSEVWAVREQHTSAGVARDICAVPLDGSAAEDATGIRSIVAGSDFLAYPRLSPDGRQLAWIAWNHPQMPWDGTELRVADIGADGRCAAWRVLLGGETESVLQPEWADSTSLFAISDRTGWWNIYQLSTIEQGGTTNDDVRPLHPLAEEFAGPLWHLGRCWYAQLSDGKLLTTRTLGTDQLALLDPDTGTLADLDLGALSTVALAAVHVDGRVLIVAGGAQVSSGLRLLDLARNEPGAVTTTDIRLGNDTLPLPAYLPLAEPMTFPAGWKNRASEAVVHTLVYRPRNPDFIAPAGERAPYIAFVHGGPTAHVTPVFDVVKAYFTSRGIGVVDVNYGGSTGYGRNYRERLRGQWGVVDVADTVAAVLGLAAAGLADADRLAIEGGSAGGWTVLAALTRTDTFACGVSYFGVAELLKLAQETHDFESRYLDGLIGPLPQARDLYLDRAPLSHVDGLSCPVLLLQGLDDPIVPPSQAEMFRDALIGKGIPHAYLAYEGESHGFRRAETIVNARQAELSFYGQVLGFEPADTPPLTLWRPPS